MACDHARDRALLLSLGLFGAPADQGARDREARAAESREPADAGPAKRG